MTRPRSTAREPEADQPDHEPRQHEDQEHGEQSRDGAQDAKAEILQGRQEEAAHRLAPRARVRKAPEHECDDDINHDEIDDNDDGGQKLALKIDQPRGADGFEVGDAGLRERVLRDGHELAGQCAVPPGEAPQRRQARHRPSRASATDRSSMPGVPASSGGGERLLQTRDGLGSRARQRLAERESSTSGGISAITPREPTLMSEPPSSGCESTGPVSPLGDQVVEDPLGGRRRAPADRARGRAP